MAYINGNKVLPEEIIALIQEYVDGEYIYIPRKDEKRKSWGENTSTRQELRERNQAIYNGYKEGASVGELAEDYYLSIKSIQRILLQQKRIHVLPRSG